VCTVHLLPDPSILHPIMRGIKKGDGGRVGWLAGYSGGQVTTSCSEECKLPTESKLPAESKLLTESKLPTESKPSTFVLRVQSGPVLLFSLGLFFSSVRLSCSTVEACLVFH
jgi:hypothetical protein